MPKKKRQGAIYKRGEFRLDWDRRADGSLRSPYLAVFWYDAERGGGRSASAGTAEIEDGKAFLDALYLEKTGGQAICPACLRPLAREGGYLVSEAIATYKSLHAAGLPSEDAIEHRLDHVLDYLEASGQAGAKCEEIDERWISKFRAWLGEQPIISPKARIERKRSLATIEASVAQLSAAINDAHRRRNTPHPAGFKIQSMRGLNHTPQHRSAIDELAAMFRYCLEPDISAELASPHWGRQREPIDAAALLDIRKRERAALHRFLMLSCATLARPDAAYDFSLQPDRQQLVAGGLIINLNPKGRRQTKKYRATIPAARQISPILSAAPKAFFVGPKSIRRAWKGMAAALGLPGDRESGEKLIRRSMGNLTRERLPEEAWGELSMFMGHDKTDPITDLYAPFSPNYLRRALAAIEAIIDEIQARTPGAFASAGGKIVSIGRKA